MEPSYHYEVNGRNGYTAIDLYNGKKRLRTVIIHLSCKQACLICGELNQAIEYGKLAAEQALTS